MASFSDSSKQQAAQQAAPRAAAQAPADEWYDQGFDLNDETQIFDYAHSGINPDLIPSAEQKLEASEYNQVRSDAQESLQSGNLKLDIASVGQIAAGESGHERGPRRGAIMVGGQGKIEDIPLSLDLAKAHESIYTDEYKERARKEEAAAAAKAQAEAHASVYNDAYLEHKNQPHPTDDAAASNYADAGFDEFATRVHHEGGLSDADLRFLQSQRLKEGQNDAPQAVAMPHQSAAHSSARLNAPKAVAPRNSAAINERMRHQAPRAVQPRDSAAINERMGSEHGGPAAATPAANTRQERIERSQQQAQARREELREEQRVARLRRQQRLQEQQERQAAQQAAQQAKTEAAASRLQRAQERRAAQGAQAARAARPDDNYLQHQAAAMLKEQEQALQRLSPLERQQAQGRAHNLAVLAQHRAQRAAEQAQRTAELAQRDKEHRDRNAASLYALQERDRAQVKAANAAHHGSYQFEPVEEHKRNSALDSLQAQGESLVPAARASALDAVGSGADLMEQEPVDPDAPSSTFNALQDGTFAAEQALKAQESARAQAQYEAEVAARAAEVQARLAQIDADKAKRAAAKAQEEQELADEFDAWTHEKGGAVNPHLTGPEPTRSLDDYQTLTPVHQRTKNIDDFADLRTPSEHQRTKSIYDFQDLRTAEHHRTKSLDDFADISGTQYGFSDSKEQKFFAPPQGKALPQGGLVATSGAASNKAQNQAGGATIEEHDYGTYLYGSSIGDSALEQDANLQEYADTTHAFEVLERKGARMAYGRKDARVANGITAAGGAGLSQGGGSPALEFTPKQKGSGGLGHSEYLGSAQRGASVANPTQSNAGSSAPHQGQGSASIQEQLTDMSTAGHRARGGQEKSLEELAREYPGLSMEHLVKLKRSSNRCHLVSRTPIFDAASNITMYELKFTAGKVFQVNALKSEHVYHVLFGYFIRRGISCFIGRNRHVLVMMPLTYDLVDYLERYSVNRVVLRICPEQPVTPSALHLLTQLRRNGMSFAIDLMLLIKKEWNKAILSIEYVMIDMSGKVNEQLNVFQRLKSKAPWLKTIGFNDTKGDGYAYLAKRMIDFLDGTLWSPPIVLNQDLKNFAPAQNEVLTLIRELFKEQPNYLIFQRFLKGHESMARDMAVFLYRFRHASPRQVQNISELYNFLLEYSANRCFSVMAARAIMLTYIKVANHSSQSIIQEHYVQALVRGYFCEYISKVFNDPFVERFGFQSGMFSLLHMFLLKEEVDVIADDAYNDIFDRIYGDSELMADIIECVQAIEATDLGAIFTFIQKYQVPPASVLISYEKALMRTNELLLVLNIITTRK